MFLQRSQFLHKLISWTRSTRSESASEAMPANALSERAAAKKPDTQEGKRGEGGWGNLGIDDEGASKCQ